MTEFFGESYDPKQDKDRLLSQRDRILSLMSDGKWRTPKQISNLYGYPLSSIARRLRELRMPEHGGYFLLKRRIPVEERQAWGEDTSPRSNVYRYRITLNSRKVKKPSREKIPKPLDKIVIDPNTRTGKVFHLMSDGIWRTPYEIASLLGFYDTSVLRMLRFFREKRWGSHTVEVRRVNYGEGTHAYRLIPNTGAPKKVKKPLPYQKPKKVKKPIERRA